MAADLHLPHQLTGVNKTLTAQCHCKSVHFIVSVPTSALPLPVHLCHCSICRRTHGTLCSFHAPLPKGVEPEFIPPSSIASSLTGYLHAGALSERFFCKACGCNIGDRDLQPDPDTGKPKWHVATSIFSHHDEDTFQIRTHAFTNSAPPPNLATWLPHINSRAIHVWNPPPTAPGSTSPPKPEPTATSNLTQNDDTLLAQCHCTGVAFTISPPSPTEAAHPLLRRFLRPNPLNPSSNSTLTHRVATLCLCTDCRLTSGAHATPWTFVPLSAISPPVPDDLEGYGTLRVYRSSGNVRRGFCGVCGTTVFYAVDDPERVDEGSGERVVDVAVGLLSGSGKSTVVEEGLAWRTGRLAGVGTGREFDGGFVKGLEEGLREWGVKRHGGIVSFEIPQAVEEGV